MALALVFDAMVRLAWSDADKYQHAGDFLRMIESNLDLDLKELAACGELLHEGAGAEMVAKVKRVQAGKKFNF